MYPCMEHYHQVIYSVFTCPSVLVYLCVWVFHFCTYDDEWFVDALRDLYLQDTVYHFKANKTQMHYQLYQELYRRRHTSRYFKAHTHFRQNK